MEVAVLVVIELFQDLSIDLATLRFCDVILDGKLIDAHFIWDIRHMFFVAFPSFLMCTCKSNNVEQG